MAAPPPAERDVAAAATWHAAGEAQVADLGLPWPLARLEIAGETAGPVAVDVSTDGHVWHPVLRSGAALHADGPVRLRLDGMRPMRFLRVVGCPPPRAMVGQHVAALARFGLGMATLWEAGYRVVGPVEQAAADAPLGALLLVRNGRFGNNVRQVLQAIGFAACFGIAQIRMAGMNPLGISAPVEAGGIVFRCVPAEEQPDVLALRGAFLKPAPIRPVLSAIGDDAWRHLLEQVADPLFAPVTAGVPPAPEGVLHAHLRGGDVFRADGPVHQNYVQPPLAFAIRAVRAAVAGHGVREVRVVSEDRRNPVVDALLDWLRGAGIEGRLLSGSMEEDRRELLGARLLICAHSSFSFSLAALSRHLRACWGFWDHATGDRLLRARGVARAGWAPGPAAPYIRIGDWRNTAEQRALMLSYPEDALVPA